MPLPTPNKDESEQDFISRCMGSDAAQEFTDQKQRAAVCYSQWRDAKGKDGGKASSKKHRMDIEAQVEFFDVEEGG